MTKVSERDRVQFTYKKKAMVCRRIWIILLWWATEFCDLAHSIWQNFPQKTVGPGHQRETPTLAHNSENRHNGLWTASLGRSIARSIGLMQKSATAWHRNSSDKPAELSQRQCFNDNTTNAVMLLPNSTTQSNMSANIPPHTQHTKMSACNL